MRGASSGTVTEREMTEVIAGNGQQVVFVEEKYLTVDKRCYVGWEKVVRKPGVIDRESGECSIGSYRSKECTDSVRPWQRPLPGRGAPGSTTMPQSTF